MSFAQTFLASIGAAVLAFCATVGRISIFAGSAVSHMFSTAFLWA